MPKKDDYREFQDRMFQEIQELEEMQPERIGARKHEDWLKYHVKLGASYGLSEQQVRDLFKEGMNGIEFREVLKAASRKE